MFVRNKIRGDESLISAGGSCTIVVVRIIATKSLCKRYNRFQKFFFFENVKKKKISLKTLGKFLVKLNLSRRGTGHEAEFAQRNAHPVV